MSDHAFTLCLSGFSLLISLFLLSATQFSLQNLLLISRSASKRNKSENRSRAANSQIIFSLQSRTANHHSKIIKYDMAQSATKRTPLGIEPFWDKPTPDPPLRWEKWRVQYKLALLAKENIYSAQNLKW